VVEVSHYTVTAERSGRWWSLQAVGAPGALSQVARLDQADQIIEAIAFVTGEPEEQITIAVEPVLPPDPLLHVAQARALRAESSRANSEAARLSRLAARELAGAGLSVRDVGTVLEVSYQRAQQLISDVS